MNEAVVIATIAAVPGMIGSYLAYRASGKAAEKAAASESVKVEAGAYERARKLYEDGIRQLEDQLERLRVQLRDEIDVSTKLRTQINQLEITVSVLRQQLIKSGIELAPMKGVIDET